MAVKTQPPAAPPAAISHFSATLAIAVSFFKEGNYPESREALQVALASSEPFDARELFSLRLCLAMVEQWDGNLEESLRLYEVLSTQVGNISDDLLIGQFYGNFGYVLRRSKERDRAIFMLTGACHHFERAGDAEHYFSAENNLGNILADAQRFEEAHTHFEKAMKAVKERHNLAQVHESQAAAYCTEGEQKKDMGLLLKARKSISESLKLLEGTDRRALLGESIKTNKRIADALEKLFSIEEEKPKIEAALIASNGEPTAAARMLNMSPTSLTWKLEHQHRDLLHLRAEKKKPRGMHVAKLAPPK